MPRITIILFLLLAISCAPNRTSMLKDEIQSILKNTSGTFALAYKDLQTNKEVLINEHEIFHAASTMKTPVMIEVYKQAHARKFSMMDSILVKNEFKSIVDGSLYSLTADDDSDKDLYALVGNKMTIRDLVYRMIIVSSNLATNIVIDLVGPENVTTTLRTLGANDMKVLRGVEDQKAFEKGLNNVTSAYDLMVLFEALAKSDVADTKSCKEMIDVLFDQRFNEIIPAMLPKGVKVAHKTGNISGVRHDSGIVFLPDGRKYVIVLLSKNLENEEQGIAAMAKVSRLVYNYMLED